MKKLLLCLALVLLPFASCAKPPLKAAQESYVQIVDPEGDHMCGGNLVENRRTVLTAEHCVDSVFQVQGQVPVKILLDGRDHALLVFQKPLIGNPAKLGPSPAVGDEVLLWGRPLGIGPLLRVGVYSGPALDKDSGRVWMVYSFFGAGGDSGSGMFDYRGRIIGSVSIGIGANMFARWAPIATQSYGFTKSQWKEVRDNG